LGVSAGKFDSALAIEMGFRLTRIYLGVEC
jgi:hypothetical protein